MANPFIVNPNHLSYANQLEHCCGTQTQSDSLAAATATRKESTSTSKQTHFLPYNKHTPCPGSFQPTLCILCSTNGHKASSCQATTSNVFNQLIIVDWKSNQLISKTGKHIYLMFNVQGSCPSIGASAHDTHSCSLCGDSHHTACNCSWN